MKKKTKALMMAFILCGMLFSFNTTVNAADIAPTAVCIEHGPWTRACRGTVGTTRSHTFTYVGSLKSCSYSYVEATTVKICLYCKNYSVEDGKHAHGETGHTCNTSSNTLTSCSYPAW